jgi:drug/metabolite transporter (DMT)-like permease
MKLLSDDLNAYQIAWFRFCGYALILFPVVAIRFGRSALKPARPAMQIVRGVTMASATVAFVIGARTIDFADAIAILYAYPFLLTILAVIFLNERVRLVGWIGISGGFLGVIMVMRPEFSGFDIGSLYVFLCAVIISVQMVLNRKLGSLSHPLVISIWGAVVATLVLSIILPLYWQPINLKQFLLLSLVAASGAINQTCLVYGFSKAEASTLAPFTYFEIVASVFIGFAMFGTLPDWISWAGIGLIITSGLLVARSLGKIATPQRSPKF